MRKMTKLMTLVCKSFVLGAVLASFSLSLVEAREPKSQTMKAVRLNLWYLGVKNSFKNPEYELPSSFQDKEIKKSRKDWPEELTRALKKSNL